MNAWIKSPFTDASDQAGVHSHRDTYMPQKTDGPHKEDTSQQTARCIKGEDSGPVRSTVFSHSGDLGDIIYFLPVMRAMGGGKLKITEALAGRVPTRQNLLENDAWQTLKELLEHQEYVDSVEPSDKHDADVDGDVFREPFHFALKTDYIQAREISLVTWQARAHGVDPACQEKQWLTVEPNPVARYVFNRTSRYTNPEFPWTAVYDSLGRDAVFLGMKDEYQQFIRTVGHVPYVETENLRQAAEIIRGSECFIGNQSCLYAIVEGMKHHALLEVWPGNPNCLFQRENVHHGYDQQTCHNALQAIKASQSINTYSSE